LDHIRRLCNAAWISSEIQGSDVVYFVLTVGLMLNLCPGRLLLTLLALIAAPCMATAGPLGPNLVENGICETGDFSSWTATGTCEFVRPQLGTPPGTCGYIAIDSGLGLNKVYLDGAL